MIWTSEDKELLRNLWEAGFSQVYIAKKLNVSRRAISGQTNRMGLPNRGFVKGQFTPINRHEKPEVTAVYYGRNPTLPPLPSLMMELPNV